MPIKSVISSIVTIISFYVFWLLLAYSLIWQAIIIFIFASSFWSLSALFVKEKMIFLVSFLSLLGSLLVIPFEVSYIILASSIFIYLAILKIKDEKRVLLKFRIRKIISRGFVWYLIAMAILISMAYFFTPGLELNSIQNGFISNLEKIGYIPDEAMPMVQEQVNNFFERNSLAKALPYGLAISLFFSIIALNFIFSNLTITITSIIIWLLMRIGVLIEKNKPCQKIIIKF